MMAYTGLFFILHLSFVATIHESYATVSRTLKRLNGQVTIVSRNLKDKSADCHRRNLADIPPDLHPFIQDLDMSDNNLTMLWNTSFQRYLQLTEIDLSDNSIYYIESGTFYPLQFLRQFRLTGTWWKPSILRIPPKVFSKNNRLQYIQLMHINLTSFQNGTFEFLPKLKIMDLFDSNLKFVNITFCGKKQMQLIELSRNEIERLTPEHFVLDCHADTLSLIGNPIKVIVPRHHIIAFCTVIDSGRIPTLNISFKKSFRRNLQI